MWERLLDERIGVAVAMRTAGHGPLTSCGPEFLKPHQTRALARWNPRPRPAWPSVSPRSYTSLCSYAFSMFPFPPSEPGPP